MTRRFVIIPILLSLAAPTPVLARGPWNACQTRALCAGVQPGGGRMIKCLRDHESALTEACYIALGRWKISWRPRGGRAAAAIPAATTAAPKTNDAAPAPQ
jgi:hypothetical protein